MCTCFNRDFRQKLYTSHNNKPRRKKTHIIIGYAQQFQFLKSSNKRETISNYGKNRWQNKVTKSGKHTVRSEFRKNENKSVFHKTGDYKKLKNRKEQPKDLLSEDGSRNLVLSNEFGPEHRRKK